MACVPCGGLRAAGVAGGRTWGRGGSHCCEGRLVTGTLPFPAARPWGGQPRPAARVSRAWVVWAWGPSTGPTACALASRHCALWGWREGVPKGGASRRCEGRLRLGARPPTAARPWGGQSGSAGRRAHPFLLYPSPEKAPPPNKPSPPGPAKLCRPRPYTYDTNKDRPMAVALFNTPDQES